MSLAFNDNHIIYYHIDAQWSIDLGQIYFARPDCLSVQCWVHSTFFHSNIINPTEPNIYHYTKLFGIVVGYTPLDFPCTQLVATINYSNGALPFVVTAFPAYIAFQLLTMCHKATSVRLKLASMTQTYLHVVRTFQVIQMFMNLAMHLSAYFLFIIIICLSAYSWGIWYFPYFLFILFAATNILSPLSMHRRGDGVVSTLSFSLCINAKPMWLTDDLPWPALNHIMVLMGGIGCAHIGHCLIALYHVILPNVFAVVCHIMGCLSLSTFPSLLWEDKLWLADASVAVSMDSAL